MIHVVAAVIRDADQVFIARRPDQVHQGGLWEFPGGKKEDTESREEALCRELTEEIGIKPVEFRPLIQIPYRYPDKEVLLDVWEVSKWAGSPHGKEGQPTQWVSYDQLGRFQFPAANVNIIKAAQLPSHYLITPEAGNSENEFLQQLNSSLTSGISMVQFRQKSLNGSEFVHLASKVIRQCHAAGARVLLNASVDMVKRLDADGIQLNASQLVATKQRPLPASYWVSASCHNEIELRHADDLGLDFALLSPVQKTSTHPEATPLGWDNFSELVSHVSIPVYALGGVSRNDTIQAWNCGGQGVSAIRALWGNYSP